MLSLNFVQKRESNSMKERSGPFFIIIIILFGTGSEKKSQFLPLSVSFDSIFIILVNKTCC